MQTLMGDTYIVNTDNLDKNQLEIQGTILDIRSVETSLYVISESMLCKINLETL